MIQYIYDFLSILFDKLKEKEKIKRIILFGSFARGNPKKDSDVDIFIDVEEKNKNEINVLVKESLNEFEIKLEKSWKLKKVTNQISPIIDDLNLERWNELRRELGINGITLYGKFEGKPEKNKHLVLITYDLSKLNQKNKMKIIRNLFGYSLKKGRKNYVQQGALKKIGAERISNGILVDIGKYKEIVEILRKHKIPIKIEDLWKD